MIILHAGYNEVFVPNAEVVFRALSSSGDYHGEMNHKMIVRWLEDKLVPNLAPKCVLVMDNAAYHNVQVDRRPLMATKKTPDTRVVDQARYPMVHWHVKR